MVEHPSADLLALQEALAGRYFLERELGRGGMGVVYLARDVALDRMVAIKVLPPELAASPDLRTRFLHEARTAAQLSHPHIVPIHAVEEHAAIVLFVMGYVDGETLGERVRRTGPLPPGDAMRIMQEVAWGLAHAHARGVVHRDVKPDNILLDRETGRAMVTDFGIARASEAHTPAGGTVIGTPQYMSPEQARGEEVDGRSDLYSLGATTFFALTGRLPINGPTTAALMARLLTQTAPPVCSVRSVVPSPLARAVDRCLECKSDRRFQSAADLAERLRTALSTRPETPPPIRRFLADVDATGSEAGTALTASLTSLLTLWIAFDNDMFAGIVFYTIAGVLGGLAGLRLARLTMHARSLLRTGYSLEHVQRAITQDERFQREHDAESSRPQLSAGTATWVAGSVAASAVAAWVAHADSMVIALPAVGAALIGPTVALRRLVRDWLGGRSLLRKLTQGRFGQWLFGVAGVGLYERESPRLPGAEPTVVAIARAADKLFLALPPTQRQRLAEVPALIERLEAEALALRAGDSTEPDREASAVAALESLRLDLLRLNAGATVKGELTRDLANVARIGAEIDARLTERDDATPVTNR